MTQNQPRTMTVATINIRHDADRWEERRPLLSERLIRLWPDVIALQEVALGIEQAAILQSDLNSDARTAVYAASAEPKYGKAPIEGIGCLTRLPVIRSTRIELPGDGWRIAQALDMQFGDAVVCVVNTHLHNEPADCEEIRAKQCDMIMEYIEREAASAPDKHWILAGDFNATPSSETIERVLQTLVSAYPIIHGAEPEYTYPTPLVEDYNDPASYHCIDYIFTSPSIHVHDVRLICDEPSPDDPTLYPSDHYGLMATISITV
ncbi:MAG: endonuclease/exonuclease/phosphatase family protein [Capsulimonas sp.]|uniref:endonuclease/exonuclease/phosphatase family protein n=1 Tax=Capsulimonas sp. TaxID=2494211 RepID=UPI0032633468